MQKKTDFIIEGTKLLNYMGMADHVEIPKGITEIDSKAFFHKKMLSIIIPESVKTIRHAAFCECKELRSVTIPASVTYAERGVFYRCTKLQEIKVCNEMLANSIFKDYLESI